jgi:hypothetical protein
VFDKYATSTQTSTTSLRLYPPRPWLTSYLLSDRSKWQGGFPLYLLTTRYHLYPPIEFEFSFLGGCDLSFVPTTCAPQTGPEINAQFPCPPTSPPIAHYHPLCSTHAENELERSSVELFLSLTPQIQVLLAFPVSSSQCPITSIPRNQIRAPTLMRTPGVPSSFRLHVRKMQARASTYSRTSSALCPFKMTRIGYPSLASYLPSAHSKLRGAQPIIVRCLPFETARSGFPL